MRKLIQAALATLLWLQFALCSASSPLDERLRETQLTEGEGLLVLKAMMPKTYYANQIPGWLGIIVKKIGDESMPIMIDSVTDLTYDYALFFGKLPVGKYQVLDLHVSRAKETYTTMLRTYTSRVGRLSLHDLGLEFEVQAGALADLGVVITLPAGAARSLPVKKMSETRSEQSMQEIWTVSPEESAHILRLVQRRFPKMRRLGEENVWLKSPQLPLSQLGSLARTLRSRGADASLSGDANILTGEALGNVRFTARDGSSNWVNTGLTSPISALGVGQDGSIAAGASMGLLAILPAPGLPWQVQALPESGSKVLQIALQGKSLYVLSQAGRDVVLHKKENWETTPVWQELKRFSISAVGHSQFQMRLSTEGLSVLEYAIGWWSGNTTLYHLNLARGTWIELEIRHDSQTDGLMANLSPQGNIASVFSQRGKPQVMRVSTDQGKTWSEATGPDKFRTIFMQDRSLVFASRVEGYDASKLSAMFSLWTSRDGGLNWRRVASSPGRLERVFDLGDGIWYATQNADQLLRSADGTFEIVQNGRQLLRSEDAGKSWQNW